MSVSPRFARSTALAGMLGILTTYAVAWAASLLLPHDVKNQRAAVVPGSGCCWEVRRSDDLAWCMVQWTMGPPPPGLDATGLSRWIEQEQQRPLGKTKRLSSVPHWGQPTYAPGSPDLPALGLISHEASGWPFLAVWSTAMADPRFAEAPGSRRGVPLLSAEGQRRAHAATLNNQPNPVVVVHGALPSPIEASSPDKVAGRTVLAWRPLWTGFVLNSLIFGACWLATLVAPRSARTTRRRRRGLCPRCAYDLRHDLAAGCPECGWNRPESERP